MIARISAVSSPRRCRRRRSRARETTSWRSSRPCRRRARSRTRGRRRCRAPSGPRRPRRRSRSGRGSRPAPCGRSPRSSPSRSISILSRTLSFFSWIWATSSPEASSSTNVCAQAQRLAVDLVDALALVVLDPEVVADRQQLLPHHEPLPAGCLIASSQESHLCPFVVMSRAAEPR